MQYFNYYVSPQLRRAVLRENPEFDTFEQVCVYRFNAGCEFVGDYEEVVLSGEAGCVLDTVQYLNKVQF